MQEAWPKTEHARFAALPTLPRVLGVLSPDCQSTSRGKIVQEGAETLQEGLQAQADQERSEGGG